MRKIKANISITAAGILLCLSLICFAKSNKPIIEKIGVTRGICVVLGDRRCELALELARDSELLIYVQLRRAEDVEEARRIADEAGLYGTRIFIEKGSLLLCYLRCPKKLRPRCCVSCVRRVRP